MLGLFFYAATAVAQVYPDPHWVDESAKFRRGRPVLAKELDEFLFSTSKEKPWQTDAFLLIQDGKIIYEKYANGYHKAKPHLGWSVAKSFVNGLYGVAHRKGLVDLNQSVCDFIKEPKLDPRVCENTIKNLLQMKGNFYWNEGYEDARVKTSSVLAMLYGPGRKDMADFSIRHQVVLPAGVKRNYSSGVSNILAAALKEVVSLKEYEDMPWKWLFNPLGIRSATWEKDGANTFVGSSYIYMRPRDFARFGYLYLREGQWQEKTILTKDWVRFTRKGVGAHFWTTRVDGAPPELPQDIYAARGHWGQLIGIWPSEDLVIVRLAEDKKGAIDLLELVNKVKAYVQ